MEEKLHISATGEMITFLKRSQDTDGAYLQFEDRITHFAGSPPRHSHPDQSERFTVVKGMARLSIGRRWHMLKEGESLTVPAGVAHTFQPVGDEELILNVTFEPALDTEKFFRTMALGKPNVLQIAVLNQSLQSKFYISGIPIWLQDRMFAFLAIPARWLGYRIAE